MARRVAVVTGANKGIGLGVVRSLCRQFDGDVILTSRNAELGKAAQQKLERDENLRPKFHQLDISDHDSIVRFHDYLKENYDGLDVLVNNAAIASIGRADELPFADQAEGTLKVNFFATLDACRVLFPLLRPHARVVNVSSLMGHIGNISSEKIKIRLLSDNLAMPELEACMQSFVELSRSFSVEELRGHGFNVHREYGPYAVSKLGLTIMTRILQRELDAEQKDDIIVNAAWPGYVNTDMTGGRGLYTVEQGSDTITYLALLPPMTTGNATEIPRGKFVSDRKVVDFDNCYASLRSLELLRVGGRMFYSKLCWMLKR